MPDLTNMQGWDGTQWVNVLVNAAGKLIIDPSEILEDTPTDGEVGKAPTSNWAHDHADLPDIHHARQHAIDAAADHTGVITDTQHGVRTLANAHAHSALSGIGANDHHVAFVTADHTAIGNAAPHHAEAHTLASHTTKAHSELTGVGANDHHVKYTNAEALAAAIAGGALSSKIITATRAMTAASGDVSYTGVGFKPSVIIALATENAGGSSIGFSDSALTVIGQVLEKTVGSFGLSVLYLIYVEVSAANQKAIVKSYDADGFTLTWTKTGSPTGTATLYFLCLK